MSQETNALSKDYYLQEYCIELVLGTGGFGITYKAHDTHLDNWVAIKEYFPAEWSYRGRDGTTVHANSLGQVIIPEVQTSGYEWGLDRFLEEARVLARVQHPYVVRVKRYFRANGTAYIVMDYEEGEPLSAVLKRHNTLSEERLYGLLREVLPALEAVHHEGYLHRDLKPSNLYVRARDSCIMLIDFGAARQSLSQRSKSITGLVTPGYSPPEQYVTRSDRYGPWTDIYALGAVLYRCVTGKSPSEAPDRQMWDTLVPAVELGAGRYHPSLLAVVDRALAMRPEDRFQSVMAMEETLAKVPGFNIKKRSTLRPAPAAVRESEAHSKESAVELTLNPLPTQLTLVDSPDLRTASLSTALPVASPASLPRDTPFPGGARVESEVAPKAHPSRPQAVIAKYPERSKPPLSLADANSNNINNNINNVDVLQEIETKLWDETESAVVQTHPGKRQNLILLLILIGLLTILGGSAVKLYENYRERVASLQEEQLAQEKEATHQAAQEKAQREQEEVQQQAIARYLDQARQAMRVKDWAGAAAYLQQADSLQPGNSNVLTARAELLEVQRTATDPIETWVEPKVNMKLARIRAGCFAMGSPDNQTEHYSNETQHQICLTTNFWISQYEISNAQFRLFKPDHNSGFYKDIPLNEGQQPVVEVSWNDAVAYARWLSEQTGRRYRLPTEAEWEYAARGGTATARYWGNDPTEACSYANVADKSAQRIWGATSIHNCDDGYAAAAPVGSYSPNAFKLYDMLGNVAEWTCSEYKNSYDNEETHCSNADPHSGRRTIRGGSWNDAPRLVRAADRNGREPDVQDNDIGFRLVLEE
jgi:formylglycine-generating enzyme required for sulfatase activity/serine/threonine protein kinase